MAETTQQNNDYWMALALEMAGEAASADEVPVGAVIVRDGVLVGKGRNRKEEDLSATRHAEIVAIEEASKNLGAWRLIDCDLYVTLEPCPMCTGAIIQSRIRHLYFGTDDPKGGAVTSLYRLLDDPRWNHSTKFTAGIKKAQCSQVLSDFFRNKRKK